MPKMPKKFTNKMKTLKKQYDRTHRAATKFSKLSMRWYAKKNRRKARKFKTKEDRALKKCVNIERKIRKMKTRIEKWAKKEKAKIK